MLMWIWDQIRIVPPSHRLTCSLWSFGMNVWVYEIAAFSVWHSIVTCFLAKSKKTCIHYRQRSLGKLFFTLSFGLFDNRLKSEDAMEAEMIGTLNCRIWAGLSVELAIKIHMFVTTAGATCDTRNLQDLAPWSHLHPDSMKQICSQLENILGVTVVVRKRHFLTLTRHEIIF